LQGLGTLIKEKVLMPGENCFSVDALMQLMRGREQINFSGFKNMMAN
jgi:hypothetical protein